MQRGPFQYAHDGYADTSNSRTSLLASPGLYGQKLRPEHQDCQEELPSCPNTPSMTFSSSRRSASSSIVPCEDCAGSSAQCYCLVPGDTESFPIQGQDGDHAEYPVTSAAHLVKSRFELNEFGTGLRRRGLLPRSPVIGARSISPEGTSPMPEQARGRSNLFKDATLTGSEMELCMDPAHENSESENSDSDEDDDDDDVQDGDDDWSGPDSNLEAMVLEILGGEDLAFAAALIPMLHKIYYCQIQTITKQKVGPWCKGLSQCSPGPVDGMGSGRTTSSTGQSNETVGSSRKRQRTYDPPRPTKKIDDEEDEDEDEDDNRDAKELGEPSANGSSQQLPRLACPFYKKNPTKYCIQHGNEESSKRGDYRICEGPGFKNIQRLKEHIKRKHYPVQCERCYKIFPGSDRAAGIRVLENHRQSLNICERKDSSLKEGISEAQCADLDKKKGGKKSRPSSRIEMYMEIWDILFPGVARPSTPWYDGSYVGSRHSVPQSQASRRFSKIFNGMLDLQVARQEIRFPVGFETEMRDRFQRLGREAFEIFLRVNGVTPTTNSTSTPSDQRTSLLGGPYESISTPRTGDRWASSTPSRSSGLKSQTFSMDIHSSPSANSMIANTGRRNTRPPFSGQPQTSQQSFVPNSMSVVQNQDTAGPGFAIGTSNMPGYTDNSFPGSGLNTVDAGWLQRFNMEFHNSGSHFDGTPNTTGYESLNNVPMSQTMIASPNAPNVNDWDQDDGRGQMSYNHPS